MFLGSHVVGEKCYLITLVRSLITRNVDLVKVHATIAEVKLNSEPIVIPRSGIVKVAHNGVSPNVVWYQANSVDIVLGMRNIQQVVLKISGKKDKNSLFPLPLDDSCEAKPYGFMDIFLHM